MGILDAFAAEDRVDVKFSTFYELVKGCAEREFITNGLKHKIPHAHILAMPEPPVPVQPPAGAVRIAKLGRKRIWVDENNDFVAEVK